MFTFLGTLVNGLFKLIFGKLFGSKDPTQVALASDDAKVTEKLQETENLSNVQTQTSSARNDAVLNIVRNDPQGNEVHTDPNAAVNTGPGAFIRPD